jgi:H+/Cl- antiporter ClcA
MVSPADLESGGNQQQNGDSPFTLILKASVIGASTGGAVVLFKSSIQMLQRLLYEDLADVLPKPAFYWPIVLYPLIGGLLVGALTAVQGKERISNNVNTIASQLREEDRDLIDVEGGANSNDDAAFAGLQDTAVRSLAAIATLGSGCSLGPEGPAVELGTRISTLISSARSGSSSSSSSSSSSKQNMRELFLAGAAAGVGAGFNAPIAGIFFAIECGTKYLTEARDVDVTSRTAGGGATTWMNIVNNKSNSDGSRSSSSSSPGTDVAAMVIAATVANLVVGLGLHESQALSVQGNLFAMKSPAFELPLYIGLGLVSGGVAVAFSRLRAGAASLYKDTSNPLSALTPAQRPLLAGLLCGVTALVLPQTLFVGYATLDDILAGKIHPTVPLSMALLAGKMGLSAFSLESGLIGGVFAPSLFFGAVLGNLYHDINLWLLHGLQAATAVADTSASVSGAGAIREAIGSLTLANAPAYATVGAAAVLSAIFRAPLTSSILMLELTENHDIVVPLLVAAATSTQASYLWSRSAKKN